MMLTVYHDENSKKGSVNAVASSGTEAASLILNPFETLQIPEKRR